ncbi:hypothetical protein ANO11243_049900 [Dothideomycetidae sp. 11243]|nr:hypothetical protein ANO11243_049900 [fungal sp. No.11243]
MKSRKSHTKSRSGCNRCKQRRIKCDERRPDCATCLRRGLICVYEQQPRPVTPRPDVPAVPDPVTLPNRRTDLKLLHHFTVCTWETCGPAGEANRDLWQRQIPALAVEHDALLNALLSFSSLHMAHLGTDEADYYVELSREYRQRAVVEMSRALRRMPRRQTEATFWASVFIGLISLAGHHLPNDQKTSALSLAVELSSLWRGSGAITTLQPPCEDRPATTTWTKSALKHDGTCFTDLKERDPDLAENLSRLRACIISPSERPNSNLHEQVYLDALDHLAEAMAAVDGRRSASLTLSWLPCINSQVVHQMQAKEPVACSLGMFYGLQLQKLRHLWYIQDLGCQLVQELNASIPLTDVHMVLLANWVRERICRSEGS